MIGLICFAVVIILVIAAYADKRQRVRNFLLPPNTRRLLENNVGFYKKLDENKKKLFETRVKDFLAATTIRGVDVDVADLDKVLIAAGAIIPIFSFPDWKYNNISEVLLYSDAFDPTFNTTGAGRNVLGMVGDGAMHREMVMSQPSLRQSFSNNEDGHNTAIHEFAHLIDKADGEADGIPEYLLPKPDIKPWIDMIHDTIKEMKNGQSPDINIYGATNEAEFFAVVSEYFFEQPEKLKTKHPELYKMLERMFHPAPAT